MSMFVDASFFPAFFSLLSPQNRELARVRALVFVPYVQPSVVFTLPRILSAGVLSRHRLSRRRFRRDIARARYYKTHIKHSVVGILLLNCFCNPLPLLQLVSPHVFCILAASCTTWTSSQTDSLPRMTTRRNWTIARDKVVIFSSFKLLASSAPVRL